MIDKLKSLGFLKYGVVIPGLVIHGKIAPYPVLNERAIRAGAGIMFALGYFAFFQAFFLRDFLYIKVFVVIFFLDFFMKVVVGTKFSPMSQLANFIVSKQAPDYVGAVQKRFAWFIGLILSSSMILMIFALAYKDFQI